MVGMPPPPPPSGRPHSAPAPPGSVRPAGPPIRREDVTLPQPVAPEPVPPPPGSRHPSGRQLVVAVVVLGVLLTTAAVSAAIFAEVDDDYDTKASAGTLRDLVARGERTNDAPACPFDLEAELDIVSERLASDVVFDALDLGDTSTALIRDAGGGGAGVSCIRSHDTAAVVVAMMSLQGRSDSGELAAELLWWEYDVELDYIERHRGGRTYDVEHVDGAQPGDNFVASIWADSRLGVVLIIGGADAGELDIDAVARRSALYDLLPDVLDELDEG